VRTIELGDGQVKGCRLFGVVADRELQIASSRLVTARSEEFVVQPPNALHNDARSCSS
jgi:hypothetical protein